MILPLVGLAGVGAFVTAGSLFLIPATVDTVASLWANGVLANFRSVPDEAPNGAAGRAC